MCHIVRTIILIFVVIFYNVSAVVFYGLHQVLSGNHRSRKPKIKLLNGDAEEQVQSQKEITE